MISISHLTVGLGVCVVSLHVAVADEAGVGRECEHGIVLA